MRALSDPRRLLAPLLLLLLCLLPFVPGLHGPFLHDDYASLQLSRVGEPGWQAAFDAAFRNHSGPFRRPLASLSFAATYWWLGGGPFPFKLVNLLLHALCGGVAYLLARRLLGLLRSPLDAAGQRRAALAAMVVWTLHPLQASTVLYVVQRMAQLSALFVMLGCWWFARRLQEQPPGAGTANAAGTAGGLLLCLVLGFAGKESAVLLPVFLAVIAWLAAAQGTLPRTLATRLVLGACVVLPLAAGAAAFLAAPHWIMDSYAARPFSLGERLLTEATALWFYLRLILLPWIPAMGLYHDDYPVFGPGDWQGWLAVGAWALALLLAWRGRRRWPVAAFALCWFVGAHLLESTFLPLELVYEHRNYVALFGPALWLGHAVGLAMQRSQPLRRVGWMLPVLLLGAATMTRAHQWSSADLFAIYEQRHHPESIRANFAEGGRRVVTGDRAGAEQAYRRIQALAEAREPGQAWPLMLDPLLQCRFPGHRARWDELRARLRANPSLDKTLEFSSDIMSQLMGGTCRTLEMAQFRRTLELAYAQALRHGRADQAEMAAIHLGWTGRALDEPGYARQWLRRAADTRDGAVEPLFDLAYMDLNGGRLDAVDGEIAELRARAARHGLPIGYRIDELQGYLQQARAKAP